jgi:hypothetical protein
MVGKVVGLHEDVDWRDDSADRVPVLSKLLEAEALGPKARESKTFASSKGESIVTEVSGPGDEYRSNKENTC